MRSALTKITMMLWLLVGTAVHAHEVPASTVLLDIGTHAVGIEMQLPVSELNQALSLSLVADPATAVAQHAGEIGAYIKQHVGVETLDGQAYAQGELHPEYRRIKDSDWVIATLNMQAPANTMTSKFVLNYDVIITPVVTHNAFVSVRRDFRHALLGDTPQMIGLAGYQQTQLKIDGSGGSVLQGFNKVLRLGMQHIAEGIDHVLFLMVLLLVAPVVAIGKHWGGTAGIRQALYNTLKTVSGFTLGHSITLALGATGVVVPATPIEVLIAVSILISAIHAIRPLFAGHEHHLAAGFGLIHGLAFAGALAGFNYDAQVLDLSVLAFNMGVEVMQLAIVIAVLPWLLLMRTANVYRYFRVGTAAVTGVLAIAWMLERALGIGNPFTIVSNQLTEHAVLNIAMLAGVSLACRAREISRLCQRLLPVVRLG